VISLRLLRNIFFELDDSVRREHDQKLFKKRVRLDVRKFAFSNKAVNDWNSSSSQCVNCCTLNTLKKHLSAELELETAKLFISSMLFDIVGVI